MATNYLLKTTNTDNTILTSQIGDASITGAKLTSTVNLPIGAQLGGVDLTARITAAAGGYDFKESAVTAVLAESGDLQAYNDSDTALVTTNLPDVPAYGFLIAETDLDLKTGILENQNQALTDGDRVVFSVVSADEPAASKRTGIYTVTRVAGKGTSSAAYFYTFTRAADANSTTNFNLGALIYLNAGDLIGRALFLSAGTFNDASALWTLQASGSYTAGNGIAISNQNAISANLLAAGGLGFGDGGDGNKLIVKVAASNALSKDGSSGELSVRSADASLSGVVSASEWKVVNAVAQHGYHIDGAPVLATGTTPVTISLPATIGASKSAIVELTLLSRSAEYDSGGGYVANTTKTCLQKMTFMLERGPADDCTLLDETVILKASTAAGIGAIVATIEVAGAGNSPAIKITGVANWKISNDVSILMRLI